MIEYDFMTKQTKKDILKVKKSEPIKYGKITKLSKLTEMSYLK